MRLFGFDVDSIITPETKFIITKKRFLSSFGDEYPSFISLNEDKKVIRELVILSKSFFKGHEIQLGYEYSLESNTDGKLNSLIDSKKIILGIKAKRMPYGITTQLRFLGIKDKPDKILIMHDVPIVASNRKELLASIKDFMNEWVSINVSNIPCIITGVKKEKIKVNTIDVDYASFLL